MKLLQVIPKEKVKLKSLLKSKERSLRGKNTSFIRKGKGHWKHVKYPGWIKFEGSKQGVLIVEINTRKPEQEWQLLQAFIGYLDRHFGDKIESIFIHYR